MSNENSASETVHLLDNLTLWPLACEVPGESCERIDTTVHLDEQREIFVALCPEHAPIPYVLATAEDKPAADPHAPRSVVRYPSGAGTVTARRCACHPSRGAHVVHLNPASMAAFDARSASKAD